MTEPALMVRVESAEWQRRVCEGGDGAQATLCERADLARS